jgi:hypothetical protein
MGIVKYSKSIQYGEEYTALAYPHWSCHAGPTSVLGSFFRQLNLS